jgi:hypothetical protein
MAIALVGAIAMAIAMAAYQVKILIARQILRPNMVL